MKLTLDQATLDQAVTHHLRDIGVKAEILKLDFRYTRVPYKVFCEVELAESQDSPPPVKKATERAIASAVVESVLPILDPSTVAPAEEPVTDGPPPETPSEPLFGG